MAVDKVQVLFAGRDPRGHQCAVWLRSHPLVSRVRPCADLSDLLTFAGTGGARVAFVDLQQVADLDRSAIASLARHGVRVAGLAEVSDCDDLERLRRLGVAAVVATRDGRCDPGQLDTALRAALAPAHASAADAGAQWREVSLDHLLGGRAPSGGLGVPLLAVWGPTGAPGRSTVAEAVAREYARAGLRTLLVDADSYGGALAVRLGLLDEASTLVTAVRLADAGHLDRTTLDDLAACLPDGLRVLTGISEAARWPQLRPAGLDAVLMLAGDTYDRVVVDCGFCLEQDEELSYDTLAPQRNGATLTALARADHVIVVGTADPVGAARLQSGMAQLAELLPEAPATVLLNRIDRRSPGAGRALEHRLRAARPGLDIRLVPDDRDGGSGLREALHALVHEPVPACG